MDTRPAIELIERAAAGRRLTLVGIGGRGASGKSTLSRAIPGAQVVPTDAFWDGEGFDLARLARKVSEPLRRGETARYHAYDWEARADAGERTVEPSGIVVRDGVCALHRLFRDAYDARGVARDDERSRADWEEHWLPSEERYVSHDDPVPAAHLVVDGA